MRSKLRWVRLVLWYEVAFAALVLPAGRLVSVRQLGHPPVRAAGGGASPGRDRHAGCRGAPVAGAGPDRPRRRRGRHAATAGGARRGARPVQPLAAALDAAAVGAARGRRPARSGRARRLSRVRSGLGRRQLRLRGRGPGGGGVAQPPRPGRARSPFFRALGDDLTGRRVAAASGFLDEIAAFESEA